MLEKIGLPPKPSLRGNIWVADASHCQGCSSQFTFIFRKHHCRRCGGIFCNTCTQQRMVLRGQGDSPVRICEPCKKLEEAARLEMRYGRKTRAGRGGLLTAKSEDRYPVSGESSSNIEETHPQDNKGDISGDQPFDGEVINASPEKLRQLALEEKKKSRTLKAEGKREESLKAFKRGNELEREAAALELNLRKSRRKGLSLSNNSELSSDTKASSLEMKHSSQRNKEKDDLTAELRELGWSDVDFHDADKRPGKVSLEGELSNLLGEVSKGANTGIGAHGIDNNQVKAHRKKALELKRQGNIAEAKEELKKAKLLERQIEEQELLGDAEDSDEEFSALVRSLNFDKREDSSFGFELDQGLDFGNFGGLGEDLGIDEDLEVTPDDLHDPDMLAALQSIGWSEEKTHDEDLEIQFEHTNTKAVESEIESLKKEALSQKRAGNTEEALALLRKAKLLQKQLDNTSRGANLTDDLAVPSESSKVSMDQSDVDVGIIYGGVTTHKGTSKSKSVIQRELLALRRRAMALRREGKFDESEEELKKGKLLEKQLEELENTPKVGHSSYIHKQTGDNMITDDGDELVTDKDLNDPTYLSMLKSLGWSDDVNENNSPPSSSAATDDSSTTQSLNTQIDVSRKSKSEINRELLGLKRKSRDLRRQGDTLEAEELLRQAKVLEAHLAGLEALAEKEIPAEPMKQEEYNVLSPSTAIDGQSNEFNAASSPLTDVKDVGSVVEDRQKEMVRPHEKQGVSEFSSGKETGSQNDEQSIKQDILAHKRKALALKRNGMVGEAMEELRQAKLLEKQLEANNSPPDKSSDLDESFTLPDTSSDEVKGSGVSGAGVHDSSPNSAPKTLSSRDRFKLQQESLKHKRQALKLRREGRTEEADAEMELAKALEAQLEEASSSQNATEPVDDVVVDDFLDPQLSSALKAIGLDAFSPGSQVHEPKKQVAARIYDEERLHLQEQIKAAKLNAVRFKRAGKIDEAKDALQTARLLEKKLNPSTAK